MSLIQLIQTHAQADAEAGKWDAVAATLNAATITVRDSTPVTYASLGRDFGDAARQLVAGTIRAAAKADTPQGGELSDAHTVLLNELVGLRIDSPERQATIDALAAAGNWPAALRDGIKRSRVWQESLAQQDGLGTVTADQCREAWDLDRLSLLREQLQTQFDGVTNQIGTAEQPAAVATLRAMADTLEG